MTDIGSAVGGLVIACLVGSTLIAASLFYVGMQISKLSVSRDHSAK